ncbi:MAG: ribbon-helix-helix protein, CopG family [Leptospiraceae bacterium]|nr:ribbon-helix-helix protein, CopG family [Leptospiraceae bacterium]
MRTILEIPEEKIIVLDQISIDQKVSRAEIVRRAIDQYILDHSTARRGASFGIWKHKKIDSLSYEKKLRNEWL